MTRIALSGRLLAVLLTLATPMTPARAESAARSIANRSFSSTESSRIVDRSALLRSRTQQRAASQPRAERVAIDPVSVERTERFAQVIDHYAAQRGLDSDLVKAIVYTESGGDAHAISGSGAVGLMQLMPETAADLRIADPFNPTASIDGGTRYLRTLVDRFGSMEVALWAYNAGPGAVDRGHLPEETIRYVPRVLSVRNHFRSRRMTAMATK